MAGKIRVGRITYQSGKPVHPSFEGYTPIVVLTKSSKYGDLGPYVLADSQGRIMENKFQFSKLYPWVPASRQVYSRWNNTVIWSHPEEIHQGDDGQPTDEYWAWREKGMNNKWAVRYPVGNTSHRKLCIGVITEDGDVLGIKDGREQVYLKTYAELVKLRPLFTKLQERLAGGENLLIIEVDGPHQESLEYYKETYGVTNSFITNDTILATKKNMAIMLEDPKHSFGHGYCLAMALLGWA